MTDREKIIKGLECCSQMAGAACNECPYVNECEEGLMAGAAHLAANALSLIKEQEPRVLTLSELEDTLDTDTVVWLELRSNKMRQGHALVMSYSHAYGIMHIDTPFGDGPSQKIFNYAEYDTTWRCWSVKPAKEQREKEKWG